MSSYTGIQYVDSTVNPSMGCLGCELWNDDNKSCYAGTLHQRFGGVTPGYAPSFEQVTKFPGRMTKAAAWPDLTGTKRKYESKKKEDKPWMDGLPRLIFISDMGDSLSATIDFQYLYDEIIRNVISTQGERHEWLWLTKRPERMRQFDLWVQGNYRVLWPKNLWCGTSITTQSSTTRINSLLRIGHEKTIRFLSVEPQWEHVALNNWLPDLSWIIQGGESGASAHEFSTAWAYDLQEQCEDAKVPYFLKQLGAKVLHQGKALILEDSHGGTWDEWPDKKLMVRQFPIKPI